MSRYFRRTEAGMEENLRAGLVAGGMAVLVGAVSYYLLRLVLAREPLEPLEGASEADAPEITRRTEE